MPTRGSLKRPNRLPVKDRSKTPDPSDPEDCQRVRHFITTPRGIVNCGDSFRSMSTTSVRSLGSSEGGKDSLGSASSLIHQGSTGADRPAEPPLYRVLILGAPGVGKTTLTQQFLTSECIVEKESLNGKSCFY